MLRCNLSRCVVTTVTLFTRSMAGSRRWLLLIHQIPPTPTALRVRVWRRLQQLGAVALKSSVYMLPSNDQTREDFEWLRREINEAGAEATLCEATFLSGVSDAQLETRLRRQPEKAQRLRNRTWVTRTGIQVDRMASAWLIRRFIDPRARFRFVDTKRYRHRRGEQRFDMYEGEFTHVGEACTFEVLQQRFCAHDKALRLIAERVHDLDIKDEKFGHPDTRSLGRRLASIAAAHQSDVARLDRAAIVLDGLYASFSQPRRVHEPKRSAVGRRRRSRRRVRA